MFTLTLLLFCYFYTLNFGLQGLRLKNFNSFTDTEFSGYSEIFGKYLKIFRKILEMFEASFQEFLKRYFGQMWGHICLSLRMTAAPFSKKNYFTT